MWLDYGGWFAINQWLIARQNRRSRIFPGGMVDFLDRATQTGVMRRSGPGWQFRHRAIQDYLAPIDEPKADPPNTTQPFAS